MENNNKNNIFVKTMVFVVLAVVLTVGVTYAYFRANITGVESESTISIGGATLKIVYEGTETINAENVIPGWSAKKYFNVDITNTSGKEISYDINLVVTNSNFNITNDTGNSYLEYAVYNCTSDTDTACETVITSSSILDIQSGEKKVYSVKTKTSVKTYYALELRFPNQDAVQTQTGTNDQPLTFNGYVTLVSGGKVYEITPVSFADDDWGTIASVVSSKKEATASTYKVGDTKEVTIDGTNYTVRIANNSNYDCTLDSKTACGFVVEFVDIVEQRTMNSTSTNVGGWPATAVRTYLNGTFKSKLPSDLQSAIIDTTVVSGYGSIDSYSERGDGNWETTDKIYLLSTGEIWSNCTTGNCYDTASSSYNENGATTTRQLDYYSNKNVSKSSNYSFAVKKFNGTAAWWWLRAAVSNTYNSFGAVNSNGENSSSNADGTGVGVAPAFRIG